MKPLSQRIANIRASGAREVLGPYREKAIYLSTGTIDFDTFEHIHQAAIEAIQEDFTAYTDNRGHPPLREAIADKLKRENGIEVSADEVLVVSGSSEALGAIPQVALEPGDEAIVFDPHYLGAFQAVIELASGVPVVIPTRYEDNWNPDPAQVEAAITPRTKLLFMLSPGNPTGSVWAPESVHALAEIAIKYDLYVVSDELYEKIVFDGVRVTSPASLPGMRERTFTVNGFSKGYGMTGWRVGYVAAPQPLIDATHRAQNYVGICAPSISQRAALAALTGPQEPFDRMLAELDRRRRFVVDALDGVAGLHARPQDGTFYTLIDARELMLERGEAMRRALKDVAWGYETPASPSQLLSDYLLVVGGVYVSAGGNSEATSQGYFRVSGADKQEKLDRGVRAIRQALETL